MPINLHRGRNSGDYEILPNAELSDYDLSNFLQRRRYRRPTALPSEQTSVIPKPVGYASTGIEGYIKPIYAAGAGQGVKINAYQDDAQLEALAQGDTDALAAYKAQREKDWGTETYQAAKDRRLRQLGLDEMRLEKTAGDLEAKRSKTAFEEETRPLELAKKKAELRKLESEATLSEDKIRRREELRSMLAQSQQETAPALTTETPPNTAQKVMEMDTINTYPWPGWNNIKSLAQSHNVPNDVLYGMHLGKLATTYNNPMQLVEDANIKLPEGLPAITGEDVRPYYTDIANQWNAGATPDNALAQILKDSGIDKSSPKYARTALAIAYGIQKRYAESGEESLSEAKRAISQADAESLNKVAPKLMEVQADVATPAGVREFFVTPEKLIQQADILEKSGDSEDKTMAVQLRQNAMKRFGVPKSMSSEDIKQSVIGSMMQFYQGDPQILNYLKAQLPPEDPTQKWQRDPKLEQFLTPIIPEFRKGMDELEKAEAKEQDRRDKIVQDYANKEQEVYFDPAEKTPTPHILPKGSLAQLATLSPPERAAYLREGEKLSQEQLSNPGFQMFLKLSDGEKMNIRQKIELGKMLWKNYKITTKTPILDSFKELGVGSIKELPNAINAYSEMYGLGEVFKQTKEAGGLWSVFSDADWEVIAGIKPAETTTPIQPIGTIYYSESAKRNYTRDENGKVIWQ